MEEPPKPPLASVAELRAELRRLGYFDSGLDRFVLGGASGSSPLRSALTAAVRVGVLGGALFGVASLLAAVGLDRSLLADPRDLLILAVYLFAILGAASAALALLGAWAADRLFYRSGRSISPTLPRNIGLLATLPGIAYLAFWWRSHLVGTSAWSQATALLLSVALLAVLGRFGSLAAVSVLSATARGARLPEAPLARRRLVPLVALATIVLVGGVAAGAWFEEATPPAPDFAVRPTGLRVRLIGVDGLERRMAEQLLAKGALPTLASLLEHGSRARLRAEPEQVPAIVWTTLATGRGPEAHGIHSLGPRRLLGMRSTVLPGEEESPFASALASASELLRLSRKQPPTSVLRSAKTFWNVAAEKGLRVGVVNWWATWPADPAPSGYMVTDRAYFRLEKGGPADREIEPAAALEKLRPIMSSLVGDRPGRIDHFALGSAARLRAEYQPDLEVVYLPGLDIETMQLFAGASGADLATLSDRLDAARAAWRELDGRLRDATTDLEADDVLVLVGDPGRLARQASTTPEGLLLMSGGPIRTVDLGLVSSRDVAPTVLHLLGLPRSREMDGRILEAALEPAFRKAHPPREVDSYGRRATARRSESAFDRQMLEELKSLGYVQ